MAREISITDEIRIDASCDVVWAVIVDPAMQPIVDPRLNLVDQWGEPGVPGSGYLLSFVEPQREATFRPGGRTHSTSTASYRVQIRCEVVESIRPSTLILETWVGRRLKAREHGEFIVDGQATVLRWTIVQWPAFGLRRITEKLCRRNLPIQLSAVRREASQRD
ncbi:MAG: SRPBCC family protein [Nocardiaceae bacterium]|nr:SRPBCC family protein [Nocardiaceae bacterium]